MKKFVITKGLPASGKSTWAKEFVKNQKDWVRINNDELQLMMFGEAFAKGKGHHLDTMREAMIRVAMQKNLNIIVDNTNLHPDREKEYRERIGTYNVEIATFNRKGAEPYEFQVKDFTNIPVPELIERNKNREGKVPEKVIYDMHNKYIRKPFKPMVQDEKLPHAVIVDIDGTVADISHRGPYEQDKVMQDTVIDVVADLVRTLEKAGKTIIYISGREEYCRQDTVTWLMMNALPFDKIFLNKTGEKRSSTITKKEIFDKEIKDKYYVEFVIEDRWKNVQAWREMGLICLQCDEGFF